MSKFIVFQDTNFVTWYPNGILKKPTNIQARSIQRLSEIILGGGGGGGGGGGAVACVYMGV